MKTPSNQLIQAAAGGVAENETQIRFEAIGSVEMNCAASNDGEKSVPSFKMLAYNGGAMQVGFFYPVIIDLSGMTADQIVPILKDHRSDQVIGHSDSVEITKTQIKLTGLLSGANESTTEVIESSKNGLPWKASIGASMDVREFVDAGKSVVVNGKKFTGPITVARKSTLLESSFVPIPADSKSNTSVAATAQQEKTNMEFNEWLRAHAHDPSTITDEQRTILQAKFDEEQPRIEAATKPPQQNEPENSPQPLDTPHDVDTQIKAERAARAAESRRVGLIIEACNGKHPKIEAQAIEDGWDSDKTELAVMKAEMPQSGSFAIHAHSSDQSPEVRAQVLEAAVCASTGLKIEDYFSEQTLEASNKEFGQRIGLQQLLLEAAWEGGYAGRSYRGNERAIMQAAFSTLSLPGIFSNVANKSMRESFEAVESAWEKIAAIDSVNDFKERKSYRLTSGSEFAEVGPDGELKHGKVSEDDLSNRARTFGELLSITRQDQINDDLGALTRIPRHLGRNAHLKLNKVVWGKFLANKTTKGTDFFKLGNKNYAAGADTALGIDALTQADLLFFGQTDSENNPLSIAPKILLVPDGLNARASQLMRSLEVRNTAADTTDVTGNPHAGKFEVVRSSYLANPNMGANASALAWHLLADPRDLATIEVVFLNGQRRPTIETAQADFDTLGIQMRAYFDFGAELHEYRAGVRMKGEA